VRGEGVRCTRKGWRGVCEGGKRCVCVSGGRYTTCVCMCKGGVLEGGQGAKRLEEGFYI